jgi:hypothetical protein
MPQKETGVERQARSSLGQLLCCTKAMCYCSCLAPVAAVVTTKLLHKAAVTMKLLLLLSAPAPLMLHHMCC